jgi:hypothetical protein
VDVIGGTLEDNGRTIRLCVILLVMSVAGVITTAGTLVRALVRTLSPGAIWKADPRQPVRAGNPVRVMRPARIRG